FLLRPRKGTRRDVLAGRERGGQRLAVVLRPAFEPHGARRKGHGPRRGAPRGAGGTVSERGVRLRKNLTQRREGAKKGRYWISRNWRESPSIADFICTRIWVRDCSNRSMRRSCSTNSHVVASAFRDRRRFRSAMM